MNILVVTRDFYPRTNGGISTATGYEVDGLTAAGHNCTVVSFDGYRPAAHQKNPEQRAEIAPGTSPAVIRLSSPSAVNSAIDAASGHYDVVHLHHSTLLDFALKMAGNSIPVIKTVHILQHQMNHFRGIKTTLTGESQKRAIDICNQLIVMSESAKKELLRHYPEAAEKVIVIRPGIPDTQMAREARWPRPGRTAAYAGRFSDIKGTSCLFEATRKIISSNPENNVVIAGGLPDSPGSERRFLRKWSRGSDEIDVSRVSFPGWLDRHTLSKLFSRCSVYLSPSLFETFGLSAAEAMLHGTPVVTTASGGTEEIVEDGVSGLVVPAGDPAALACAVNTLLDDPDRCHRFGSEARKSILNRFDPGTHTERLTATYRALV